MVMRASSTTPHSGEESPRRLPSAFLVLARPEPFARPHHPRSRHLQPVCIDFQLYFRDFPVFPFCCQFKRVRHLNQNEFPALGVAKRSVHVLRDGRSFARAAVRDQRRGLLVTWAARRGYLLRAPISPIRIMENPTTSRRAMSPTAGNSSTTLPGSGDDIP